jgi:peptidyl-prolyl cis-trans isomerase D
MQLSAKYQIYNTLIKSAVYTTQSEGKLKYEMEANKVNCLLMLQFIFYYQRQ